MSKVFDRAKAAKTREQWVRGEKAGGENWRIPLVYIRAGSCEESMRKGESPRRLRAQIGGEYNY